MTDIDKTNVHERNRDRMRAAERVDAGDPCGRRSTAHEVVGLGQRGRRLPPRGQAGLRALRPQGRRPRPARRRAARACRRSTSIDVPEVAGDDGVPRRRSPTSSATPTSTTTRWSASSTPTARACATWCACAPARSRARPTSWCTPADEAEVQAVVDLAVAADAVIIPFGGGSNIAGSLEPAPTEKRGRRLARHGPHEQGARDRRGVGPRPHPGRRARPGPRGAARTRAAGPSATSRTASPTHPRRLDRDPLVGHAVGQVRRHRRHHPRPARRAARRRCSSSGRSRARPTARACAR